MGYELHERMTLNFKHHAHVSTVHSGYCKVVQEFDHVTSVGVRGVRVADTLAQSDLVPRRLGAIATTFSDLNNTRRFTYELHRKQITNRQKFVALSSLVEGLN